MLMKNYFLIIKPKLILANLISLIGGFLLSSKGYINYLMLINTVLGMFFIMASGCVLNNLIDRDIDSLMTRTKNRVLVNGLISEKNAVIYSIILNIIGFFFYKKN